jgi:hypothetical protein
MRAAEHAWIAQLAWTDPVKRGSSVCPTQCLQSLDDVLLAGQFAPRLVIELAATHVAPRGPVHQTSYPGRAGVSHL